ncbi:MAG TPA: sigma-70 family RNA polymerase sigma factor [Labilithrix sp.]
MDLDVHLPAILTRDTHAFALWMASAEPPLRDSLRSFAASVDVEAVLQETLLRVWLVAPRFEADGKPNGLFRLAVRMARNLAISEVRRTRAKPVPDEEIEKAQAADDPAPPDPLLRSVLVRCHEKLPDKPRQAIDARVAGGAADAELAESLGMRLNTFLQNVTRARKLLAECLAKHGVAVDPELSS